MAKVTKPFRFTYTAEQFTTINLKRQKVTVAEFNVHAVAYLNTSLDAFDDEDERYSIDIEFVYYQGVCIKDILDAFCDLYRLEEKALLTAPSLFETAQTDTSEPYFDLEKERWINAESEIAK